MAGRIKYLLLLLITTLVLADDIDYVASDTILIKTLRELSNHTKTDTLNLPANASSIRENITDTFSCENRTYGYYADVDNDCQVFHVCLPSQTPSGRNVTYRWSFICPNETIFNQEVLTCTRPKDSINCQDSPMYYHMNMEIGKVNKTEDPKEDKDKNDTPKTHRRRPDKRRENIVIDDEIKDFITSELKEKLQDIEFGKPAEKNPVLIDAVLEEIEPDSEDIEEEKREEMDRIVMERNMRNERQIRRGSFRFRSDV